LKSHLHRTEGSDKKLLSIYDRFMTKGGSWIGYNFSFKGQPCFPHGINRVLSRGAIFEKLLNIHQVTIESNTLIFSERWDFPEKGDSVFIGAGAKIIGAVKVGDNCRIGANAVAYKDMPSNTVAVAAPTRISKRQ
jgi:serine O-acetyltransferase